MNEPTHPTLTTILAALPQSAQVRQTGASTIVTADKISVVLTPAHDLVTIGVYRWRLGELHTLAYQRAITPDQAADLVRRWVGQEAA